MGWSHASVLHIGAPLRILPLAKMCLKTRGPEHKHSLRPGVQTESVSHLAESPAGSLMSGPLNMPLWVSLSGQDTSHITAFITRYYGFQKTPICRH